MARTRDHPTDSTGSVSKKIKTAHVQLAPNPPVSPYSEEVVAQFAPELFDHTTISKLHSAYDASEPFKHALVEKLFQDDLLKKVKDECLSELNFTEKQTDIYKVSRFPTVPLFVLTWLVHRLTKPVTSLPSPTSLPPKSPYSQIFSLSAMPSILTLSALSSAP